MNSFKTARLLAALAVFACCSAHPAHATTISNGQTKTGTVSGTGSDSYTFSADAGTGFVVTVGETGNHTDGFVPEIDITPPGGGGASSAHQFHASFVLPGAAQGTWTVKVSRADRGQDGGGYALKLIKIPGTGGTAITAGQTKSGSITRGGVDVYTFSGTAGHKAALSLAVTGGENFVPEALVFSPSGDLAGGTGCGDSCNKAVALNATGTWTIVVRKSDENDVTGTYTLSVTDSN